MSAGPLSQPVRIVAIAAAAAMLPRLALAADGPPPLDCNLGFEALRAAIAATPGAALSSEGAFDVVSLAAPEIWQARYAFTTAAQPAHPAVTLQTQRKQVTGVWTSDSKSCGYGNPDAFGLLVADLKASDNALTEASRAEVEREKQGRSPLAAP